MGGELKEPSLGYGWIITSGQFSYRKKEPWDSVTASRIQSIIFISSPLVSLFHGETCLESELERDVFLFVGATRCLGVNWKGVFVRIIDFQDVSGNRDTSQALIRHRAVVLSYQNRLPKQNSASLPFLSPLLDSFLLFCLHPDCFYSTTLFGKSEILAGFFSTSFDAKRPWAWEHKYLKAYHLVLRFLLPVDVCSLVIIKSISEKGLKRAGVRLHWGCDCFRMDTERLFLP